MYAHTHTQISMMGGSQFAGQGINAVYIDRSSVDRSRAAAAAAATQFAALRGLSNQTTFEIPAMHSRAPQ